jgi:hypothetical protein
MSAKDAGSRKKPRGITVVLDANVLVADFRLEGASATALLSHSALKSVEVGVPQVALDEAINKYRDDAVRATADVSKLLASLKRLGVASDLPIDSVDDLSEAYADSIKKRLKKYGISTLPYPDVSHEQLARLAIAKRSPFDQQGRGYRDALIWHTVIGLVHDRDVWLVSDDNDFRAAGSDGLAVSLVSDLKSVQRSASDVRLFRSIKDCVAELGQVIEKPKQDISRRLRDDPGYLQTLINSIKEGLRWKAIRGFELKRPASLADEATIDVVEDIRDVYVQDARLVSTGELLVRLDAMVDVSVGLFIEKSEIGEIEEYQENADDESYDESFDIDDRDWSPRYVSAHAEVRLNVALSAIADRKSLDFQKIDVDEYSVVDTA